MKDVAEPGSLYVWVSPDSTQGNSGESGDHGLDSPPRPLEVHPCCKQQGAAGAGNGMVLVHLGVIDRR